MLRPFHSRWPSLAALLVAGAASAQPALPAWRSAFEGYRPFADEPLTSWRESNDNVGRIGGWRAYAREAQQPAAPATATTPSPGVSPAPATPAILPPAGPAVPPPATAPARGHNH